VTGPGYPGYQPTASRLRFADGRVLKGRECASLPRAVTVEYVSRHVQHPGLPAFIGRYGRALLTDWVEGRPLEAGDCTPALLRQCGALQGFIHSVALPPDGKDAPYYTPPRWRTSLEADLDSLLRVELLADKEARQALEVCRAYTPERYEVGFIHHDFCAENIVLHPSGEGHVVDNENLRIDAYSLDLARTWYRWPMDPSQRRAYLEGYRLRRSTDEFIAHFPYWAVVSLVSAATFRLKREVAAAAVPARRLCSLLHGLAHGARPDAAPFVC
jgi:aminoglycoside phosphotransferase (APT) family kinase protein